MVVTPNDWGLCKTFSGMQCAFWDTDSCFFNWENLLKLLCNFSCNFLNSVFHTNICCFSKLRGCFFFQLKNLEREKWIPIPQRNPNVLNTASLWWKTEETATVDVLYLIYLILICSVLGNISSSDQKLLKHFHVLNK